MDPGWTAVILVGGRAARLGTPKAMAMIDGRTMLDHVRAGLPREVPVVIAGRVDPAAAVGARWVVEEPEGSGPAAGLAAALPLVSTDLVGVLAVDMPFAGAIVAMAAHRLARGDISVDAVVAFDSRPQPLCSAYRTNALRAALAALGEPAGLPMHRILAALSTERLDAADLAADLLDVDTPSDLAAARRRMASGGAP